MFNVRKNKTLSLQYKKRKYPNSNVLSVDIKTWDKRHNCIKSKIRNIHWVNLAFYKQGYKNYDILSETPS
jgi:hypothetical protein